MTSGSRGIDFRLFKSVLVQGEKSAKKLALNMPWSLKEHPYI